MADIANLLRVVKGRVNALKNLQVQCAQIDAKLYEESHDPERKYAVLYQPPFDKRFEIMNAIDEPAEGECEWKPDEAVKFRRGRKKRPRLKMRKRMKKKKTLKEFPNFG
jgi:nucleosome assembly protein 1-like 1